jgi:hypothetical protein
MFSLSILAGPSGSRLVILKDVLSLAMVMIGLEWSLRELVESAWALGDESESESERVSE